ncbi:MAG: ATP-binding protein [Bacteroidota bacterium]|nr:ATP-binding protein [Bacteroidota bacterium]
MAELKFKVSAALKDIIGRDLITDEYIAVFELVKNAFDAHATQVDIYFENIYSGQAKIIIKDDGKGMNYNDLLERWLFVAYSAKKEGTEDDNYDYRNSIHSKRAFAGAKGIGRFSCDRLGRHLLLETTKDEPNPKTEILITDWEKFEGNMKEEFIDIHVLHETSQKSNFNVLHGTVLEITELRNDWNRPKLLKLKSSLAKLINPRKESGEPDFKIFLHVAEEKDKDLESEEDHDIVNGPVENFIFETLGLKTTKIYSFISEDASTITTELKDGGTLIYRIQEKNNHDLLDSIHISLFYLNQSAKVTFTKRMGLPSSSYGHVFLYKNGFRIYPYGESGSDPLKIDVRKAQGVRRFFGTRELIGQIEIYSKTDQFKETSSRGDGLIKTNAYDQLENYFWEVLKKLEKYVVEIQQWGLNFEDDLTLGVQARATELIAKLSGSKDLVNFEVADNFLEILHYSQKDSAETIFKNLKKLALERQDDKLIEQADRANNRLYELQEAKNEAEKQAEEEFRKAQEATEKLKQQISENLFLKSINTSDYQEVISLLHHIGIYAGTIDNNLKGISLRVQNSINLSNEELNDIVKVISFETKKILNVVAFATKANFMLKTEQIEVDLKNYIQEYVDNIIPTVTDKSLKIIVNVLTEKSFPRVIKPIELNIVIDNLISNAKKASANVLNIQLSDNKNGNLVVKFIDNGSGISENHFDRIYDFGFTTTDGSGIGLYHVKEIIKVMKGSISAQNNETSGATFTLELK